MNRSAQNAPGARLLYKSGVVTGLALAFAIICVSSSSWIRSHSQVRTNSQLIHIDEVNTIGLPSLETPNLNTNENIDIGIPSTGDEIETSVRGRKGLRRRRRSRRNRRRRRRGPHRRRRSRRSRRSRRRRRGPHRRRRKYRRRVRRRPKRRGLRIRKGRRGVHLIPEPVGRPLGDPPLGRGTPLGRGPENIRRLEKERAADTARRLEGDRLKERLVRHGVSILEAKLRHERARELAIKRETILLKKKAFKYAEKYPKTCSCEKVPTNSNSNCFYFIDKEEGTCSRRQCRTSYKCAHGRDTGVICMRRLTAKKIVPIDAGICKTVSITEFMYVPYSYGYGRYND